jgi:phage-related baseplate assembly protein
MLTIDELFTPPTEDEIFNTFIATLESTGVPANSWRKGGVARTILRIVAVLYAGFASIISIIAKAGYLDTATGGWLTLLSKFVYGVTRIVATFATGTVTVHNGGGGVYAFEIGEFKCKSLASGKVYTNSQRFPLIGNFNPGDTLDVPIIALELGTASNAAPAAIDTIVSNITDGTVTNVAAVVGQDEESDEDLRQRDRDSLGALSPFGPRGAYRFAIRSALLPNGTSVNVNRVYLQPFSSTGRELAYVASPSGAVTAPELTAIVANVEDKARPDTDTFELHSATQVNYTATLTVYAKKTKGIAANDIEAAVDRRLIPFIAEYPIGGRTKPSATQGYLFAQSLAEAADRVTVDTTKADETVLDTIWLVENSGGDLPLNIGQVAALATTIVVRITEDFAA